jgi:hypothetical protein
MDLAHWIFSRGKKSRLNYMQNIGAQYIGILCIMAPAAGINISIHFGRQNIGVPFWGHRLKYLVASFQ